VSYVKIQEEKDIIFHVSKNILPFFIKCVKNASPNEASGLIFGNVEQYKQMEEYQYHYFSKYFECVESNYKSPVAFLLNDDELLYQIALNVELQQDLRLIGVFHSHPSGTTPSSVDYNAMKMFYDANITKFKHLIWIIMDSQNNEISGFMIFKSALTQVQVNFE
jgi:proteasome lid subunit RPN8/RPN11